MTCGRYWAATAIRPATWFMARAAFPPGIGCFSAALMRASSIAFCVQSMPKSVPSEPNTILSAP